MLSPARVLSLLLAASCLLLSFAPAAAAALAGGAAFQHATGGTLGGGTALAEDRTGFVWLGTQGGLVRWDGYLERSYAADPTRADALPDTFIRILHVDSAGSLWVGTNAGGLARFDALRENFERIADPEGLVGSEAAALADRSPRSLWVGGSRGLAWLDLDTRRLHREPSPAALGAIKSLRVGRDGTLWVAGDGGLWRRRADGRDFEAIRLPTRDGLPPRATGLLEDSQGRIWVGTRLRGAYVVAPGANVAEPVREAGDGLSSDTVQDLIEARPGEVWIGTYGNGVLRVDVASGHARRERHVATRPNSLLDDSVGALLRARSGLLWVATNYGLSRHDPRQDLTDALFGGPGQPVRSDNLAAVLSLDDGRLWLSMGEFGAQILNRASGAVTELRANPAQPETALPKARVIALAQVPGDEVWIGTQGGLYRARRDGSRLQRVHLPGVPPTAEFWALARQGHTLWIGGRLGLWSLDLSAPRQPLAVRSWALPAGTRVTSLAATATDLWVGTNDGLGRLAQGESQVVMLPSNAADPSALTGGLVSSLLFDRQGRLWVASFGRGLQVAQGRRADGSLTFRRFGTADGLPHNGVDALALDRDGHIWVSTDDGLARIHGDTLALRAFRAAQQVGITLFWTGASAVTPQGEVLFGGQGGLLVVHPDRVRDEAAPPRPTVTEASIGGHPVPAMALLAEGGITVPAARRSLLVEFASLAFTERDELRYEYRLQGFDSDWVRAPVQRRLASYTNLAPGPYELQVRVARQRGEWSPPLSVPITVQPHWYEHKAAHAAFVLLALGLLYGVGQLRTVVLRGRQARLEALVAQRTAELERRTHELHASQAQLEQMAFSDGLTGLANRRLFNEEFRQTIAEVQRGGDGFAVVLIDLDRFKEVNDAYGHDAGDAVLVVAAQRLRDCVRAGDRVARLGGDEFVALLRPIGEESDADEAVCRRIVETMARPIGLPQGQHAQIGASVGVVRCPRDADDAEGLLKAADTALYEAKRAGRGRWQRWQRPLTDAPTPMGEEAP